MTDYINNTIAHYNDETFAWTVVENAIDNTTLELNKNTVWNQIDDEDYICSAFKIAK